MDLILIAILSFVFACLVNCFYWIPKFRKANEKLFNTQKSYYRSVDITRKLRDKAIQHKANEENWMHFLKGEG